MSAYSAVQWKRYRKGATCKVEGVQLRTGFEPDPPINLGGYHGVGKTESS
jgi:hypothetical protein